MEFQVENIKCNGCATSIKNGLMKLDGVNEVNVDIDHGQVIIKGDESLLNKTTILSKLKAMGYPEPGNGSTLTTATSFVSCMIGRVS
jgi:copper chaperone